MVVFAVALASVAIALCLVNLLLTVGVIRRLRQYGDSRPQQTDWSPLTKVGEEVGAFTAVTSEGKQISQEFFTGGTTLVAVFAQGCAPCEEQAPEFARYAREFPGGRERVLAVVTSMGQDASAKRDLLERVATVVVEEAPESPVEKALGVHSYPAYGIVGPGGMIRASAGTIGELVRS